MFVFVSGLQKGDSEEDLLFIYPLPPSVQSFSTPFSKAFIFLFSFSVDNTMDGVVNHAEPSSHLMLHTFI